MHPKNCQPTVDKYFRFLSLLIQKLRLFQYTDIDEFTRLRFLTAYPEQNTYSSADFLKKLFKWYARRCIRVECIQTDNGLNSPTVFPAASRICQCSLKQLLNWHSAQAYSPLHAPSQWKGRAQPPGRPETLLLLP